MRPGIPRLRSSKSDRRASLLGHTLLLLAVAIPTLSDILAQENLAAESTTVPARPEVSTPHQVCSSFGLESQASGDQLCLSIAGLAAAGRWNEARPLAERLSQELPSKGVGPYWLGLIELQAGNAISAFRQLDTALERNPTVLWVHLNLGLCYAILRQDRLFELEMQWVIDRHPDQSLPYYYLGRSLFETQGRYRSWLGAAPKGCESQSV